MAATGEEVVLFPPDLELGLRHDLLLSGHTARTHAQSVRELHAFPTKRYTIKTSQPCTHTWADWLPHKARSKHTTKKRKQG